MEKIIIHPFLTGPTCRLDLRLLLEVFFVFVSVHFTDIIYIMYYTLYNVMYLIFDTIVLTILQYNYNIEHLA